MGRVAKYVVLLSRFISSLGIWHIGTHSSILMASVYYRSLLEFPLALNYAAISALPSSAPLSLEERTFAKDSGSTYAKMGCISICPLSTLTGNDGDTEGVKGIGPVAID